MAEDWLVVVAFGLGVILTLLTELAIWCFITKIHTSSKLQLHIRQSDSHAELVSINSPDSVASLHTDNISPDPATAFTQTDVVCTNQRAHPDMVANGLTQSALVANGLTHSTMDNNGLTHSTMVANGLTQSALVANGLTQSAMDTNGLTHSTMVVNELTQSDMVANGLQPDQAQSNMVANQLEAGHADAQLIDDESKVLEAPRVDATSCISRHSLSLLRPCSCWTMTSSEIIFENADEDGCTKAIWQSQLQVPQSCELNKALLRTQPVSDQMLHCATETLPSGCYRISRSSFFDELERESPFDGTLVDSQCYQQCNFSSTFFMPKRPQLMPTNLIKQSPVHKTKETKRQVYFSQRDALQAT